jgi:hypothetical protein
LEVENKSELGNEIEGERLKDLEVVVGDEEINEVLKWDGEMLGEQVVVGDGDRRSSSGVGEGEEKNVAGDLIGEDNNTISHASLEWFEIGGKDRK